MKGNDERGRRLCAVSWGVLGSSVEMVRQSLVAQKRGASR